MTRTYPYRPLEGSSVRLIRILEDDPMEDLVRCKLVHLPLDVSPPPTYIAISYTWGSAERKKTIQIDGHDVRIPHNLYEALCAIRYWESIDAAKGYGPWLAEDTLLFVRRPWLLWADAICINQGDENEKAQQIPKMINIFGSAQEVIGWLGPHLPPGVTNDMIHHVLEKGKTLTKARMKGDMNWVELWLGSEKNLRRILGDIDEQDLKAFADVVFAIAQVPWFSRLWVIQELAISSKRPVGLSLGGHLFDAEDFYYLIMVFAHRPSWFRMPSTLECPISMYQVRRRYEVHAGIQKPDAYLEMPESQDELVMFAWRLHGLLAKASTAPFESTIPHDMIYGILSLAKPPEHMPPELAIDYSSEWSEVCWRYARFITEKTGAISHLTRLRWTEELSRTWLSFTPDVPSWVPNFANMSITSHLGPWSHVERSRYTGSEVTFSEDRRAMTLDGFSMRKPVALTRRQNLVEKQNKYYSTKEPTPFYRADAQEFVDQIIKPATAQQGRSLDEVLVAWMDTWERSFDRGITHSEVPMIKRTFKRWIRGHGPEALDLMGHKINGRTFSDRGRIVWQRLNNKSMMRNWIITEDGRGWMTLFLDEVMPEDIIVVLRGMEEHPAVLRRVSSSEREDIARYRLMGLLIERIPLVTGGWEHLFRREEGEVVDFAWTRFTIV